MFKFTMLCILSFCSLMLIGCNTMRGLGEDIEAGGSKLAKAASPSPKTPVVDPAKK
jgi:predicted small secreted protein